MSTTADISPETLRSGGKAALARALALADSELSPGLAAALDRAVAQPRALSVGITGPPGVGKSSLASALMARFRAKGLSVGAIAVDPSSKATRGALLGDRARFDVDPEDPGVFVRSMAARTRLGGVAEETFAAVALMRSVMDRLIVETVGVGQSETEVALITDLVLLCVQPGAGDSLQYMKAGIAEVPDVAVVTKADLGSLARRARSDLEAAMALGRADQPPGVLLVSAASQDGIDELVASLERVWSNRRASGELDRRRAAQHAAWGEGLLRERHGRQGLRAAALCPVGPEGEGPFARTVRIAALLDERLRLTPG